MLNFDMLKNVNNPNSVHGIYPYRGKISAIDAEKMIGQFDHSKTILDPFCGSGTIVYEAQKAEMKAIGIDLNPIAIDIARGKTEISENKESEIINVTNVIELAHEEVHCDIKDSLLEYFHEDTARQIIRVRKHIGLMSPYVYACFLGAIALAARGCNGYLWTSSTVGKSVYPKVYVNFYEKLLHKVKRHYYPTKINSSTVMLFDARRLSEIIEPESIDYVYTSPPYFDCLDYTAYYAKIVYEILEIDRDAIRTNLIQSISNYKTDMIEVMNQIYRVTRKGASIIFVVGNKKTRTRTINGAEFFLEISPFKNAKVINRKYTGTSSQIFDKLNRTSREEQVIVWKKD